MKQWKSLVAVVAAVAVAFVACGSAGENANTNQRSSPLPDSSPALNGVAGSDLHGINGSDDAYTTRLAVHTKDGHDVAMAVWVADDEELRECGLMHQMAMPPDHGMLFTFDQDSTGAFWNRNTFIPLTLAWIASDGSIVDLTDMPSVSPDEHPQHNTLVSPKASYRYVIEANQGFFANNNITIGDRVNLLNAVTHGSAGAVPNCRTLGTDG